MDPVRPPDGGPDSAAAPDLASQVRGLRSGVPWRRLFSYLRPHRAPFVVALGGLFLGSGLSLLVPLVVAGLVTAVVAGSDPAGLDGLIVTLVALFLAQSLGGFVQSYVRGVIGERIVAQLRAQLFTRLVTLSLDNESERLVQDALERLMHGRTTVVVAHRLSTIRAADRIAVLDDGWLVDLGTQADLLAREGLYDRLYRLQFSVEPAQAGAAG